MIRTTVIPNSDIVSFSIPKDYIGKELEVIAFAKEEGVQKAQTKKQVTFTVLHVEDKNFKFNRNEANER